MAPLASDSAPMAGDSVPTCVLLRVPTGFEVLSVTARVRHQTTYLVECSLPVPSEKHRRALQGAVQEASQRLSASGSPVRYLGTLFVPDRSRCYSIFEAVSIDAVRAVNEAAMVPYIAINEAIDLRIPASDSTAEMDGQHGAAIRRIS